MAQANATDLRISSQESDNNKQDVVESFIRQIDRSVKETTGTSLFHILTIGSIGASIALYMSGKRSLGIFIGLWPPTFQALKAAAENRKELNF